MNVRSALLHLAGAVLATGCLAACGSAIAPATEGDGGFDGDWTLVAGALDGQPLRLTSRAPVTLTVDGSEVSGRSACNSYTGTLETDADRATFTGLGGTDMGCEPDVMALETAYHQAMARVTTSAATADTLTLSGPDVELEFQPVAPVVAVPLAGTVWLLEAIVSGDDPDASVSSPIAEPSTLVFSADGTFSSVTACKEHGGTWRETSEGVVTDLVPHPTPFCGRDVEEQIGAVLGVLIGSLSATIAGDQLTLTRSDGTGLVYRASDATPSATSAG